MEKHIMDILKLMALLKLNPKKGDGEGENEGFCYGFACMAAKHFLSEPKKIKNFEEMLGKIKNLKSKDVTQDFKDNSKNDIVVFLKSVKRFQDSGQCRNLNPEWKNQHILTVPDASKNKVLNGQNLKEVALFSGVYSRNKFISYLKSIQELKTTKRCAIILSVDGYHSIMIGFDAKQKRWFIHNHGKSSSFSSDDLNLGVEQISYALGFGIQNKNKSMILTSEVFSMEKQPTFNAWMESENFKETHKITDEKSKLTSCSGGTWLTSAANIGDLESVKNLMKKRFSDINFKDKEGFTALMKASINNHVTTVKELLSYEPDINATDTIGFTALIFAVKNNNLSVVETLLSEDANVNCSIKDGWTALMFAVENNNLDIVKALLNDNHIKVNHVNEFGLTALIVAAKNNNLDIVKTLLDKNADISFASKSGWTALLFAAQNNNLSMFKALLEKDTSLNSKNVNAVQNGSTALLFAAKNNNINMVKVLLKKGANVNAKNKSGGTALIYAANNKNLKMVENLLNYEAEINSSDDRNWTALKCCAKNNDLPMFEKLLNKGAKVNNAIGKSDPALIYAVEKNNVEMVGKLISHHANINSLDGRGISPLYLSAQSGFIEITKLLLSTKKCKLIPVQPGIENLKNRAKKLNKLVQFKKLLSDRHVNPNKNEGKLNGFNALHAAILFQDLDMVALLVKSQLPKSNENKPCQISPYDFFKLRYDEGSNLNHQKTACGATLLLLKLKLKPSDEQIKALFENFQLAKAVYAACHYLEKQNKKSPQTTSYIKELFKSPNEIQYLTKRWIKSTQAFGFFKSSGNDKMRSHYAEQYGLLKGKVLKHRLARRPAPPKPSSLPPSPPPPSAKPSSS